MNLQEELVTMLASKFDMPADELRAGETFDNLGLDSLVLLEVSLVIRNDFGVALSEEELVPLLTLAELASLVQAKRTAA